MVSTTTYLRLLYTDTIQIHTFTSFLSWKFTPRMETYIYIYISRYAITSLCHYTSTIVQSHGMGIFYATELTIV